MKNDTPYVLKWVYTAIFFGIAIDAIYQNQFGYCITCVVLSLIPWSNFKSLKVVGTGIEWYEQLDKAAKSVEAVESINVKKKSSSKNILREAKPEAPKRTVTVPLNEQPDVKILMYRHDIEDRLQRLGEKHKLIEISGEWPTPMGWLHLLKKSGILSGLEALAIENTWQLYSESIHGFTLESDAVDAALELGPVVINMLDEKLKEST